ncbi:AAA family ATPase [Sinomonas albida]|uniref:AAA family ATPase n=1 Tax=Sinomonas albida TaxID=369942 RepID=UPI003017D99F
MTHADDEVIMSGVAPDQHITIRDCNSIGEANISLRPGALNIKYGPNGIGKSTIARALTLRTERDGSLEELTPFKHRLSKDGPRPSVEGADAIKSVLTFNDSYVSQFVFQPDEVLKNSFEIFINTEEYREGLAEIEAMFEALKKTFEDQAEFNEALTGFTALRDAFNLTKGGAVAKTSKGYKALRVGGKLKNIPEQLQGYKGFLDSDDPAGWITWQSKGKGYLELSDNCPFCSVSSVDKATALKVSEEYESAAVKTMSALRGVIDRLGRYFDPDYLQQLEELTSSITGVSPEQELFLVTLRSQIETLLRKLSALKGLSFHALRDEENVAAVLGELKIDLKLLHALNSETTRSVVDLINVKLDEVAGQINDIRRRIGQQKTRVARLIKTNQDAINEFLTSAGYRYLVRIEPHADSYRMLLEHQDAPGHLEAASTHLSYGEKNAFALVLFMHHVQREKPDLVVLDDPVSSFDKTKKFAILHQLFHGKNSLRGATSILLTHDIEPAIDIVRAGTSDQFIAADPVVHFLSGRSGKVVEKPIRPADIATFSQVCDANITSASDPIIQCIYLRRRFEVHGARGVEYDLLSSLLHARDVPTRKTTTGEHVPLEAQEVHEATEAVREYIESFDYVRLLTELKEPGALKARFVATEVGYEKVQLFRIMSALNSVALKGDDVFTKFVNETYHIENEYVMQLNPRDFDAVPEFVIAACTALVEESAAA